MFVSRYAYDFLIFLILLAIFAQEFVYTQAKKCCNEVQLQVPTIILLAQSDITCHSKSNIDVSIVDSILYTAFLLPGVKVFNIELWHV